MTSDKKRIVITGMGVMSSIGTDLASFEKNLFAGASGITQRSFSYHKGEVSYAVGAVPDFDVSLYVPAKKIALMDRFAVLGVAAAKQAFDDSGLVLDDQLAQETGVIVGSGVGGQGTLEDSYHQLLDADKSGRLHPFTIPRLMPNAPTSQISMSLGLKGPGFTVASACASGLHAIGVALQFMRAGLVKKIVTGGAESCLTLGTLKGWEALRVMAPDLCRPFSASRAGLILGEGAAMFVLETYEDAVARGAKIYAELAGIGMTSDAADLTSPDVGGSSRAIIKALADAGVPPEGVDYINAHGTGTRLNDTTETAAVKKALGEEAARRTPLSSSKSMFGHALGAAGAIEMVATVLAVQKDRLPPTVNYLGPDPECDLDYVPNVARDKKVGVALNNAFAFGGLNAVAVVKKVAQ